MKLYYYRYLTITFFWVSLFVFGVAQVSYAQTTLVSDGLGLGAGNLEEYFGNLFNLALLVGGILAVLIIAASGLQYMTSTASGTLSESKTRIRNALIGILMLLGIWIFFEEINPGILNLNLELQEAPQSTTSTGGSGQGTEQNTDEAAAQAAQLRVQQRQQALQSMNASLENMNIIRTGPLVDIEGISVLERFSQIVETSTGEQCPLNAATGAYTLTSGGSGAQCPGIDLATQGCCIYQLNIDVVEQY